MTGNETFWILMFLMLAYYEVTRVNRNKWW